jgi:DeoR family suf operon transcriptional repressor
MVIETERKNTREQILQILLARKRCTINELAEVVGINQISIRHHVMKMEAEGLVETEEERHGVGRPHRMYFLSEKGREHFPTHYVRLTVRLLEQLKEQANPIFIKRLFTQMAEDMASDYQVEAKSLDIEEKLELIQKILSQEGFTVEIEKHENSFYIKEISCPYFHIGQNHPEVCAIDQTLISSLLDIPAHKVQCLLEGDSLCTYIIPNEVVQSSEQLPVEGAE